MTTSQLATQNFVPTNASQHTEEKTDLMTYQNYAMLAGKNLCQINTLNKSVAAAHVLSITDHEILPEVWDLTVEDDHEFFANEILVHNCLDATRYALQPLIKDLGVYSEGQVTWSY